MKNYIDLPIRGKSNIEGGKLYPPVNCENDTLMVYKYGIRVPLLQPVIRFKKSEKEKENLKRVKRNSNKLSGGSSVIGSKPLDNIVTGKLIIYLKNTAKDKEGAFKRNNFKTTYSFNCTKAEVNDILRQFRSKGFIINKSFFRI